MKPEIYREFVLETEVGTLNTYDKKTHALVGMNGEAGECIDLLKKTLFQGHPFRLDRLLSELGDVCWYTMLLMTEFDIDVDTIFDHWSFHMVEPKYDVDKTYGLDYIFDLNRNCGESYNIINYWDGLTDTPRLNIIHNIRAIFYDIKMVANIFDLTIEDIFDINVNKIKFRYPDGFSCNDSINRQSKYRGVKLPDTVETDSILDKVHKYISTNARIKPRTHNRGYK